MIIRFSFLSTYVEKIWNETFKVTGKLYHPHGGLDRSSKILGTEVGTDYAVLAIHAETLLRILQLRDEADYLLRPQIFVRLVIEHLTRREVNEAMSQNLKDLLLR